MEQYALVVAVVETARCGKLSLRSRTAAQISNCDANGNCIKICLYAEPFALCNITHLLNITRFDYDISIMINRYQ